MDFPVGTRVVLCGLQKAPEQNGKRGDVQSVGSERFHVRLDDDGRVLAVRASNLELEPRSVASLNIKELKLILQKSNHRVEELGGMDKHDLQAAVAEFSTPERNAEILLAHKKEQLQQSSPTSTASMGVSAEQIKKATEQMNSMDPEQLRQQAAMLRNMPPDVLRRQNPMLRNMTDEQIRQAAVQFEMMASNPAMMKAATEQLSGMSPEDLKRQGSTDNSGAANAAVSSAIPAALAGDPAEMLKNMDPETIKQQVKMMKSMPPSQLRLLNPQFASMSDDQIRQFTAQMDMLASNPTMMKMATEQMKNLSPDDIKALQEQRMPVGTMGAEMDPIAFLSKTSGKQVKEMLQTAKANPDVLRAVAPTADQQQLQGWIDRIGSMDESTLDRIISILTKLSYVVRPIWGAYQKANRAFAGHLLKIIGLLPIVVFLFQRYGRRITDKVIETGEVSTEEPAMAFEDEF